MSAWTQITNKDFARLFAAQYAELDAAERSAFDQYKVSLWKAVIHRSEQAGDETVFVVAQNQDGVLYFDDGGN